MLFRSSSLAHTCSLGLLALTIGLASCSKDDQPATPQLRAKMDYASLTATTPYTTTFKDDKGASTVDLGAAAVRLDMFSELNSYMGSVAAAAPATPAPLDAARLRNYFANTGAPFSTAALNTSGVNLREATAASLPATGANEVRAYLDTQFGALATASQSVNSTASAGQAGRLGRYLVDAKGFEVNQVIQKALLGALLLDQIGNVQLSDQVLLVNNSAVVAGKAYTAQEHAWDMAYGYMTSNPLMTTDINATPRERFLAGYLNEKNGPASPAVYQAFLKGRAAIVNNDKSTLDAQKAIIRTELEKTLALSAVSYLNSWKAAAGQDSKAHALAEGLGFIYALRFAKKYGADAAWSDGVLNGLTTKPRGAWDLTNADADAAAAAITSKFAL